MRTLARVGSTAPASNTFPNAGPIPIGKAALVVVASVVIVQRCAPRSLLIRICSPAGVTWGPEPRPVAGEKNDAAIGAVPPIACQSVVAQPSTPQAEAAKQSPNATPSELSTGPTQ